MVLFMLLLNMVCLLTGFTQHALDKLNLVHCMEMILEIFQKKI